MAKMHLFKVFLVLTLLTVAWAAPTPETGDSPPSKEPDTGDSPPSNETDTGDSPPPQEPDTGKSPPPPEDPSIIVTSPGAGPWAIGSQQAVTWRTENDNVEAPYSPDTTVIYGIIAKTATGEEIVVKTNGPFKFGGGFAPLNIDCDFVPKVPYHVQVQLTKPGKDGSLVFGNSGIFTVYETADKSICPAKPAPPEEPTGPGEPEESGEGGPAKGPEPEGDNGTGPSKGDNGPPPQGDNGPPPPNNSTNTEPPPAGETDTRPPPEEPTTTTNETDSSS